MTETLERFQGRARDGELKSRGVQQNMEANMARVDEIEKRLGAVENRSTTLGSEIDGERRRALFFFFFGVGGTMRTQRRPHWTRQGVSCSRYALT